MELTLDLALVRSILSQEARAAHDDIAALGPVRAVALAGARQDSRIESAGDFGTLACKPGCTWCCNFLVDARAPEVFAILDYMERELPATERARVLEEISTNRARLAPLSDEERLERNVKCPFLSQARCAIYPVRPQTCRNYHATDVAGCQKAFEEPENTEIDPEFAPLVYQSGLAHVEAFSKSLSDEGYDASAYELNSALAAALEDPRGTRERFDAKLAPFPSLTGTIVDYVLLEE
jgi:Fe-S-cluster containining protein